MLSRVRRGRRAAVDFVVLFRVGRIFACFLFLDFFFFELLKMTIIEIEMTV